MSRIRVLISALILSLVAAVVAVPGIQLASPTSERLANGGFEEGFVSTQAGFVGRGWSWFHNGGFTTYGFYDDTWAPVVHEGLHSQLIEINTTGLRKADVDRYAGIYQTVAVVPETVYELSLHGMLRAREGDPDLCCDNYRVEYGVDYSGGRDWTAVDNWVEIPWDKVHPRLTPGSMDSFAAKLTPTGPRMTLYIRAWKKWATTGRELDVNLDAISLRGAMPEDQGIPSVGLTVPVYPVAGWSYNVSVLASNDVGILMLDLYDNGEPVGSLKSEVGFLDVSHRFTWTPATSGRHILTAVAYDVVGEKISAWEAVQVGEEGQFLTNGGFEGGFAPRARGMVGTGWGWFDNGGPATYGSYDETWRPVVKEGLHSQMIEINTLGRSDSDPDRFAGIYQTVDGLTPGATYRLSLYGMLRSMGDEEGDTSNPYRVQWGYDPSGGTDWLAVDNWKEIPWDTVYPRLEPGDMSSFMTEFEASSSKVTLFLRAWKKWGTPGRELDVNLDAISLKGYK